MAIAIGGAIAAIVATVISQAVKVQRSSGGRDELGEFSLFIKEIIRSDSTCTPLLNGRPFLVNGKTDLVLRASYDNMTDAQIGRGFTFANDKLEVMELSIEDRTANPVEFRVAVRQNSGGTRNVRVRRHMARVKLHVKNKSTGQELHPRYFELPILYNAENNHIEVCNNEINIGEACQALGFRWDASKVPPECVPSQTCLYGGAFTLRVDGSCRDSDKNPATGECSCPGGYTQISTGSVNISSSCSRGCDQIRYDTVYQCFRCPKP